MSRDNVSLKSKANLNICAGAVFDMYIPKKVLPCIYITNN